MLGLNRLGFVLGWVGGFVVSTLLGYCVGYDELN